MNRPKIDKLEDSLGNDRGLDMKIYSQLSNLIDYVDYLEKRVDKQDKFIFNKISKPDTGEWKETANKNKQDFIKPTIDDLKEYFIFRGTLYYKNLPCKLVTFNVKTYQGLVQKTRCAIKYINSGYVQNVSINDLLIKVTNNAQYIGAPGEEQ